MNHQEAKMSRASANFSDLSLARDLSLRLMPRAKPSEVEETRPRTVTYVTFRAQPEPSEQRRVHVASHRPPEPSVALEPPPPVRNWDDMLRWCLSVTAAKTVFVMDSQGFVIAKEGSWSYEDAEAMGTQIMVALDRFDELDSTNKRALSVSVEFRSFWLTGIRVPAESPDCFTLGVLRNDPPSAQIVQHVSREVSARASQL